MARTDAAPERSSVADAALEQMAKGGLDSVTLHTVASRLGEDVEAIARSFPDKQALRDAMAQRLFADVPAQAGPGQGWQDWMRLRAKALRQTLLDHRDGSRLAADARGTVAGTEGMLMPLLRDGFGGDRAREAVQTLDRFVIGWCLDEAARIERSDASPRTAREMKFEFGLEALIAGLAVTRDQLPPAALRSRRRAVTMGIWALLRHVRQSALTDYRQLIDVTELERRLLMEIRGGSVSRSADMIAISGLDKAQVSRAVRRLDELGLVSRETMRGPLRLTPEGESLAEQIIVIALRRNGEIIAGIDPGDLADFIALAAEMTARAALLLEQEQTLAVPGGAVTAVAMPEAGSGPEQRMSVVPQLITLLAYLQRSGALMIRRVADISNFEWFVMSTVNERGPLTPASLIESVERDHSQARRTLRHLIKLGLVRQFTLPGRRGRMLQLTDEGKASAARLEDEGWQRDTILYGSIEPDRLDRFFAVLDILVKNAVAQLDREPAGAG